MMGTEVVERRRGEMDLRTPPWQQWNEGMVKLAKRTVLPAAASDTEVYFCLALAESIGLNPFANEIYFIPSKARDGQPGKVSAYVGREGLVKRASEYDAYFESDTVHEHDDFVVTRQANGKRTVKHSYGHSSKRGEIVGAYAFLHGSRWAIPAFFYAELDQYKPTFDADWKLSKSPWGNQLSAMIEKCAMIGAGRKRLNLAGVLIDGEVERVQQQQAGHGPASITTGESEFDWQRLTAPQATVDRLRSAVEAANALAPQAWPAARCEMTFSGMSEEELDAAAERVERQVQALRLRAQESASAAPQTPDAPEAAGMPSGPQGGLSESEAVTDAEVVPELTQEQRARADGLRVRLAQLEERMSTVEPDTEEFSALSAEIDHVSAELAALEDPGQTTLDV